METSITSEIVKIKSYKDSNHPEEYNNMIISGDLKAFKYACQWTSIYGYNYWKQCKDIEFEIGDKKVIVLLSTDMSSDFNAYAYSYHFNILISGVGEGRSERYKTGIEQPSNLTGDFNYDFYFIPSKCEIIVSGDNFLEIHIVLRCSKDNRNVAHNIKIEW